MRIRYRIFLTIAAILVPSLTLLGILIPAAVESNMITDAENKLLHDRGVAEVLINQTLETYDYYEFRKKSIDIAFRLKDITGLRVSVFDGSSLLADSSNIQDNMTAEVENALQGLTNYRKTEKYIFFAFPVKNLGAVRLAYPLSTINAVTSNTKVFIIITGTFILIAALLTAGLLSKKLSTPLVELDSQVKKVREGSYDISVDIKSKDEIGRLALSFAELSQKVKQQIGYLEQLVEKEKKLKNLQQDFMSSVTHEFKTPLTSIIGYADLIEQYKDDPKLLSDGLKVIKNEGERLHQMVEKVLFLSRMEKFELELKFEEINVEQLVDKSINGVMIKAQNAGIKINKESAYTGTGKGDFDMLYRMLVNLLDNSIKYNTEDGTVLLRTERIENNIVFTIKDTGIGIKKEHLDKIFQPFYRADKNRSRKIGGDGLGLSIVKEIVNKHNGDIKINSTADKGTEIIISIPAEC